jgi:hypothetical protein
LLIASFTLLFLNFLRQFFQLKGQDIKNYKLSPLLIAFAIISVLLSLPLKFLPTIGLFVFFIFFYKKKSQDRNLIQKPLYLALLFSSIFHFIFYKFSNYIWSQNLIVDPQEITEWLRKWYVVPRDGWEGPILYASLLLVLTGSIFIATVGFNNFQNFFTKVISKCVFKYIDLIGGIEYIEKIKRSVAKPLKVISILLIIIFIWRIEFQLPMAKLEAHSFLYAFVSLLVILLNIKIYSYGRRAFLLLLSLELLPICFLAITETFSTWDYNYVLLPALKLVRGFKLSEIYFQYDLMPSLFAAPFLYFKMNPSYLQIVGQASSYTLFIVLFLFSQKILKHKQLVIPFILSVVATRIYASYYDASFVFQITPIRLDWWIVPLLLASRFKLNHWTVGLCLGALVFCHKNFGIIYSLAYIQVILLLGLIDTIDLFRKKEKFIKNFLSLLLSYLKKYSIPLALLFLLTVFSFWIHDEIGLSDAAKVYQKLGFGFNRTVSNSFFWFIPIMISFVVIKLIQKRHQLKPLYFETVLFLITLTSGCLLYFLGRSHESNLNWLSGSLLLVLFIGQDLVFSDLNLKNKTIGKFNWDSNKIAEYTISYFPILLLLVVFSGNFKDRLNFQYKRIVTKEVFTPFEYKFDAEEIRTATNGSTKVYSMQGRGPEFLHYYYGNYNPVEFYSPFEAWVFTKDVVKSMQKLLDDGYYIITGTKEIVSKLKYNDTIKTKNFTIIHIDPNI